jgi:hypothetical protein
MFCAPGLVFGCTVGVGYHFHILRARTHFRRYGRRCVLFSCFALPNTFSTVWRATGPVFMFCAPRHVFGCAKGVGSRFQDLLSRTRFRWFRGRRVPFSCFASPYSFSAVPRASGPVLMFCAIRLVFDDTEGVGSRFHVLRARTHFQRCRGRRVPFSCLACPYLFSTVPRASDSIFMFCAPRIVFGATEGVRSHLHVLHSRTCF